MTTKITHTNLLPLENGDRLTRYEFERRYQAMTQVKKAELIEGIVYMASPVRATKHGRPHAKIMTWLGNYCAATPGVDLQDNATVRLDADNEPQPDALLRIEPEVGGNSRITEDDYIQGSPELIAEIAASSASYDLNDKLNAYRRNGVKEYIVWQMYENRLDWFILKEGRYISLEADKLGIIRSEVFPGLWLAVNALREGNLAEVLTVLQQGLQTDEHQKFVQKLQQN
ncbi:MAG: Uma2 family endonuclease [Rivularia sp. T60_A2020_040]|nr:Uma2 family endonuclease [Rivularia sp. T60_A2020_040]